MDKLIPRRVFIYIVQEAESEIAWVGVQEGGEIQ